MLSCVFLMQIANFATQMVHPFTAKRRSPLPEKSWPATAIILYCGKNEVKRIVFCICSLLFLTNNSALYAPTMKLQLQDWIWTNNLQPLQENNNSQQRVHLQGEIVSLFNFSLCFEKAHNIFLLKVNTQCKHKNPSLQTRSGAATGTNPLPRICQLGWWAQGEVVCDSQFLVYFCINSQYFSQKVDPSLPKSNTISLSIL